MELGGLRIAPGGIHGDTGSGVIGESALKAEEGEVRVREGDGVRNSLPDEDEM